MIALDEIHPNTISKYLKALEEFNVVIKKKASKRVIYFLNDSFLKN
jgi:predicted transcriptional regulator